MASTSEHSGIFYDTCFEGCYCPPTLPRVPFGVPKVNEVLRASILKALAVKIARRPLRASILKVLASVAVRLKCSIASKVLEHVLYSIYVL